MNQRKAFDPCLLCKSNPATKTKSHILPKFLSTGYLGSKGQRKGYTLNTETVLDGKRKVVQDSVKEDFIVCPDCESYFSVLEDLSSSLFLRWRDKIATRECTLNHIEDDLTVLTCRYLSPHILNLFIYSMFWRASISDHDVFINTRLAPSFEEELRQILLQYQSTSKTTFLDKLTTLPPVPAYPSAIMSATSFIDETKNFLYASHTQNPYVLLIDKYLFWLFDSEDNAKGNGLTSYFNRQSDEFKIVLFSANVWDETVLTGLVEMVKRIAIQNKNGADIAD